MTSTMNLVSVILSDYGAFFRSHDKSFGGVMLHPSIEGIIYMGFRVVMPAVIAGL